MSELGFNVFFSQVCGRFNAKTITGRHSMHDKLFTQNIRTYKHFIRTSTQLYSVLIKM